jgi:hypothetical protein
MEQQQDQLRAFLAAVRQRWFADEAMRAIGLAGIAAAAPAIAGLLLYWLWAPSGAALVFLAAAAALASAVAAATGVFRMQPRPDDRHVARFIEERAALLPGVDSFDDALVTAVETEATADAAFRPLLLAAAVRRLEGTQPVVIVPAARLRQAALQAVAGTAVLAVTLIAAYRPLQRAVETAWIMFFPGAIHVDVRPGDVRVVAGSPVEIRAVVRSRARAVTELVPTLTVTAGNERRSVPMHADNGAFVFPFESVDRSFRYTVSAGRATSTPYTVTALREPRIERIELRYEYPSFSGLRPYSEDDGGDIYGPAGTRVTVRVHADKPVVAGAMMMSDRSARAFKRASERVLEGELVLARDDSYRLRLADADGLSADGDTEYFIRLMDDRPPDVRILRPAGDQQITPLEEVAIEARAEDDYGIASLELVYSVAGGQAHVLPFARTSGSTDLIRTGAHLLAAENLRVKPGDVITYYARARDVGRGKRPTEARSDMYFLEVRPFGEEFVAAESQGGGGASSAQIESLIAAQKEIISATWNIERRSRTGISSADVKAVAQAQAELKARAEQMRTPRAPGRFQPPQQVRPGQTAAPPSSGDPVRTAIQAMTRALEHLDGQRTTDALTHEMAALQALLEAQAAVRRREVQQQANGSAGGGSGRQGEDLSALFDKELQRHQRTNYETRSHVEERPDRSTDDSALDRIRDLARRQEEINRQLRELEDSKVSAEERKRQLERLNREQNELREQAEEMARRAAAQSGANQRGSQQQQQQQGGQRGAQAGAGERERGERGQSGTSNGMRSAADLMRGAAGDLQRDDLGSASQQAAGAAERLRQIEQQMRGDSPESRRRAAGELQLEAQQLAQEQRRIAAEADRLERGQGSVNADARRRLSGEKEQLADRVDALQRNAGELAKGQGDARMTGAARELERQQLGKRMREGAASMRAGEATASAERQIADALDRVVQQFGADGTPAGGRGQLDETRAIRDRLDRLERQIAEAEAKEKGGRSGSSGRSGSADGELQRLREEYARGLQQARETLKRMQESAPQSGLGGSTPEKHEWSPADPGTQGFKQDFSAWESLRKDINLALERTEAAASARRASQAAQDRLSGGGSDRVPEAYRKLIARYFESLARPKK